MRPALVKGEFLSFIQVGNQRSKDKAPTRKFSTFIKKMIVELDRDPSLYPEGNIVEVGHWHSPGNPYELTLI